MKKRSGFRVMLRLLGLVKPLTGVMLAAVLMGLAGHLCAAFIPILGGRAILQAAGFPAPLGQTALLLLLCVLALARGVLRYAEQSCNHYIAFKLLALIRDRLFRALRRLCPARLEQRDKGDLISLITADTELLEVFYAHTISPICIAVLFTLVLLAVIGRFHWLLGAVALLAYLTVGAAVPIVMSRRAGDAGLAARNKAGELSSFVLDSLRGLPELLQFGWGGRRLAEMTEQGEALAEEERKLSRNAGVNRAVSNTVVLFFDLVMLFVSLVLYRRGRVALPGVVIPTVALMSSFGPVLALARLGSTLQSTFAAGNRILDILEEEPQVRDIEGEEPIGFDGAAMEKVSFAYGGEEVLHGVDMDVRSGEILGIRGRSGSGKSTMLKLLMRFWDAREGTVRISGRDIRRVNTAGLREMESYVTQDTVLFHDSIRSNLRLARLDATDEEIEAACRKASVHDFILSLPQGYDSMVGELGDTLSGGERQRLGLARAFLHAAPLLLLDEPTSNLDSLNEGVVLRSLCEQREGKTVVIVSHRESTLRIADRVIAVENGEIVG